MAEPLLETLTALAASYKLQDWDGFDKTHQTALVGGSFLLLVAVEGRQKIQARGSNRFPANYERFPFMLSFSGMVG